MSRAALALLLAAALAVAGAAPAAAQSAATASTRTITVDGAKVAYRSIGSGRPIVFVMGLGGTMDAWDPTFIDRIVAQGRRVIVFDNEGIGRSAKRPGTITIRRMGDTAAGLIRALRLRRADVFGWSMGGMIAQSLAVRHPRVVRRLVLAATAPGDRQATLPDGDVLAALATPGGNPARALGLLFPEGDSAGAERYIAAVTRRRSPNLQAPGAIRQAQVIASGNWMGGNDPDGARVRRLRIPVLVGGGARDRVLPPANQRHLASVIPGAQRAIYPDAAHGFFVQHARRFAARVDRFLGRLR
jgi:pimeloyl-ACP methyl ester carboxylesterase